MRLIETFPYCLITTLLTTTRLRAPLFSFAGDSRRRQHPLRASSASSDGDGGRLSVDIALSCRHRSGRLRVLLASTIQSPMATTFASPSLCLATENDDNGGGGDSSHDYYALRNGILFMRSNCLRVNGMASTIPASYSDKSKKILGARPRGAPRICAHVKSERTSLGCVCVCVLSAVVSLAAPAPTRFSLLRVFLARRSFFGD